MLSPFVGDMIFCLSDHFPYFLRYSNFPCCIHKLCIIVSHWVHLILQGKRLVNPELYLSSESTMVSQAKTLKFWFLCVDLNLTTCPSVASWPHSSSGFWSSSYPWIFSVSFRSYSILFILFSFHFRLDQTGFLLPTDERMLTFPTETV